MITLDQTIDFLIDEIEKQCNALWEEMQNEV